MRDCRELGLNCGCCLGFPWVVITTRDRRDDALLFEEGIWQGIWAQNEASGCLIWFDHSLGKVVKQLRADREIVVEALGRGIGEFGSEDEKRKETERKIDEVSGLEVEEEKAVN